LENNNATKGGLIFVGCIILGLGLGLFFHRLVEIMMIGLGVGFLLFGLVWKEGKKN